MLEGLFEQARLASERRATSVSASQLEQRISALKPPVDAYLALAPAKQIKLIAEIKRRSPSKGFLADIPSAADQALRYQDFGAHAISVLTEESGFGGRLEDLELASKAVEIPLLRKDFISNEYQILEARANGADFVLLILAWLSASKFKELFDFAHSLGLGVLVETHTLEEIDIANQAGARLIGINTRNLETFATDIGLFEKMAGRLNPDAIKVAESAVRDVQDVIRYRSAGADAVLVGEALVKGDPSVLIPEFVSVT
ncbi:indole-3-glycerol-phosphate synthase [Aquiluna borgnonia]|uniref:indole-3-glycerol-phosphate synthase n=1 Tax=Aquiluna borgnonia TaxID=2499157 RepID=A0A7D4TU76_9MICO|nr:indole-3-glycerol phosphate synthase TrpC [Aquiluna borgnonia]QKJ25295.1 indole-3-glycerol-phosphate synthase [Aquiluna borgnonia]